MGKKQLSSLLSRTQKKTEKHHKRGVTASPNLEDPQTVTTPREPLLSKEEILDGVRCSPMVKVYAEEIERWSKTVYGSESALRKETEKILENPQRKDSFLKQIKENPASVHPLAGMKIFNFKTDLRREAEQAVSRLCSAIDVYAEAIKYAYANINIKAPEENTAMKRNLQKSLDVQQKKASFSNESLIDTEQNHSSVGKCYAEIEHLSQVVYGNPHALQKQMEEVLQNPAAGMNLAWSVAVYPESFHKLVGRNICGFKNDERIRAEENLLLLHDAIKNYTNAVKEAKKPTLQKQQIQQKRTEESERQRLEMIQRVQKIRERHQAAKRNTQQEKDEGAVAHATVPSVKTSLSSEKIRDMIKNNPSVQRHCKNVEYWSQATYGDAHIFQKSMEDILRNPAMGEKILQYVAKNPAAFHKLAGHKIGRFKDDTRKCAEDSLSHLGKALRNYTEAVKEAKDAILQEHEMQQRFVVSESPRQEAKQKFQKPQERQHTQQRHVQQHKANSGKGVALTM